MVDYSEYWAKTRYHSLMRPIDERQFKERVLKVLDEHIAAADKRAEDPDWDSHFDGFCSAAALRAFRAEFE